MTGHILFEGEVGTEVTAKTIRDNIALYPQATEWMIHINSGGGDVDEGYAIGAILESLPNTTAVIEATCASIATFAACSCDRVVMNPQGDFMIHLPTGTMSGNEDDFLKGAERLRRIKNELINKYLPKVAKNGVTRDQLSDMMEKETSMSPQEAHAMGFVDEVREKLKAVAKMDTKKFNDMTKEETKGLFEELGNKIDKLFQALKPKNSVAITLADGSVVESSADAPEALVGSTLTDEMGQPLPDGDVETADGQVITIAGGVVTAVAPKAADSVEDPAAKLKALEEENAALKQQLAEAGQKAEAEQKIQAQSVAEFKNQVKELKADLEKIKNQTFGDSSVPSDATDKKYTNKQTDPQLEVMAQQMGQAFITSRRF